MDQSRIFGTPLSPIFNMRHSWGMSAELLEDTLYVLAAENEKAMKNADHAIGWFKHGKAAEMLFLVCEEFKLPAEVRYLAVEMLDRFLMLHVQHLYTSAKDTGKGSAAEWSRVEGQLQKQMMLWILVCVQMASKVSSHYKIVTPGKACRFLVDAGHNFTRSEVIRSELKVLKTLNFNLSIPSPLTYLETLLEILGHNDSSVEVKVLHATSLKVLDLTYMQRHLVYNKLYMMATRSNTPASPDREKFVTVECDLMLLAVAVIGAASYILDMTTSDKVIDQLGCITRIPGEDIVDFATILVECLIPSDLRIIQ
ncbi:PREDICTED: cyclin N-terminal domain-containing protein 1-like [Branchiostoma belcheri]|uniref:Cyclin N-terminal domain-containing protein 1-like n=1 Tax=Branchiostoma belcheri TaxID=7741 RepID=A0A6P4ZD35_BRABE|nr:PREDICTED: cyclin N-terminal domain-containing protein 1-like [Branchiostoma belcheri]